MEIFEKLWKSFGLWLQFANKSSKILKITKREL